MKTMVMTTTEENNGIDDGRW